MAGLRSVAMPEVRPIADDSMAVGVDDAGNVAIMFPDGSPPYEIGPETALGMGRALISASEFARLVRSRNAARAN